MVLGHDTRPPRAKAYVLHPELKRSGEVQTRAPEQKLEEALGLAEAIELELLGGEILPLRAIRPSTYLGKGKVEDLKAYIEANEIELIIMNTQLSPSQQRNLERGLNAKVIDRTALILEIFGERARTKEGTLQVELASLEYQKSRLVRSWTHLERQRGGFGFTGGPGETQIEIDRRLIAERIAQIKKDLDKVKRTRTLHRKSRTEVPYPTIALVGYTNAGKSTLFNRLSGAKVMAKDMLFATLDPTMRLISLPSKRKVILSDTVGFISDLPTQLVAAFHATLEEVIEAEIILHIRDIACDDTEAQKEDVFSVLKSLGIEETLEENVIEVCNKIDLTDIAAHAAKENVVYLSALEGSGTEDVLKAIDTMLDRDETQHQFTLPASAGKLISWLYANGKNATSTQEEDSIIINVLLSQKNAAQFEVMMKKTLSL